MKNLVKRARVAAGTAWGHDGEDEREVRRILRECADALEPDPIEASAAFDDARAHAENIRFGMPLTAAMILKLCARIEELENGPDHDTLRAQGTCPNCFGPLHDGSCP